MDYIEALQFLRALCYAFLTLGATYISIEFIQSRRRAMAGIFASLAMFWLIGLATIANIFLGQDAELARAILTLPLLFQVATYVALFVEERRRRADAPHEKAPGV